MTRANLTDSEVVPVVLPCVSTSTAKLVKCVVLHSTVLLTLIVDTPSSDQEFLYTKLLDFTTTTAAVVTLTCLVAKKHILPDC